MPTQPNLPNDNKKVVNIIIAGVAIGIIGYLIYKKRKEKKEHEKKS
jgi:LPXTG-motif cell wall-anchored protein